MAACIKTIASSKELRKLNLSLEKNKKNEIRATKIKDDYLKKLDIIIKKASYGYSKQGENST